MFSKKNLIIAGILIIAIISGFIGITKTTSQEENSKLITEVKEGKFEVVVTTTGELQARQSTEIKGPEALRNRELGLREIKIIDMVQEGTVVDSGDYVAELDQTEALSKLKDIEDELEKKKSEYTKARLDTAMELKKLRNDLIDQEQRVEEHKLKMKQSQYEPPSTQRQAEIEYERAKRELQQAKENYQLKVEQARATMNEVEINLEKQQRTKQNMERVLEEFAITAPQNGMVIYEKNWNGEKRKEGSTISPWDLTVATLPDLSGLISITYVNEIDISRINTGQKVRISVDAFPDNVYTGTVREVANIGQEIKNSGAKVFEVTINLDETDDILRPSMTTSNQIITDAYENVKYLPLEAVHTEKDKAFVYTINNEKKYIETGTTNENHIIVENIEKGEKVRLDVPKQ
ncbi:MAG: efflux RND transporter periplasmic adaptor subunit [Bacteroidales bacterium]